MVMMVMVMMMMLDCNIRTQSSDDIMLIYDSAGMKCDEIEDNPEKGGREEGKANRLEEI